MTKTKTVEAQTRTSLKKAATFHDREGLANLSAAATAMKAAFHFGDMDLALGLMAYVATLPAAKKLKMIEAGRAERLRLLPTVLGDDAAVDLIARIPGDLPDLSEVTQQLVSLGLPMNRKRKGSNFVEFTGLSDEAAVRAVVEPVGGCVTTIASPSHSASPPVSDLDKEAATGKPPGDEVAPDANAGEDKISAGEYEPEMHAGEAGEDRHGANAWVQDDESSENFPVVIPGADGGHSDSAPFSGP